MEEIKEYFQYSIPNEHFAPKKLFHGSHTRFSVGDTISPRTSFHGAPYVYATSDYDYAVVRAGNFDPYTPLIREEYSGTGQYELDELSDGAFDKTFSGIGYVYELKGDFSPLPGGMPNEYTTDKNALIVAVHIVNIMDYIKNSDSYQLFHFGEKDWSTVTGGYSGYMDRRLKNIKKLKENTQKTKQTP